MKRILVCEDEDAIRDFVVINLKRSGYDVIDVSNAAQAMEAYIHYGGQIDIALLDIMMPGMDGSELCRWLRQKSDTMGIIMLSAKSHGLDTCLQAYWSDYHQVIRDVLGLASEEMVLAGMAVGYADNEATINRLVSEREPVDSFATFLDR